MVCSFFGHRDSPWALYNKLVYEIETLVQRGITDFIVGNHGSFDSMAVKALHELKEKNPSISFTVVLAYVPGEKQEGNPDCEINSILPCEIRNQGKKIISVAREGEND